MVYFVLTAIAAVIFTLYVVMVTREGGIRPSLSDSYYLLEGRSKGLGMAFYVMLMLVVFTCIAPMCEVAGGFGVLAGFALLLVGAAPKFKDRKAMERTLHIGGAVVAAIVAIIVLARARVIYIVLPSLVLFLALAVASKTLRKSLVFWAEMAAFYALFAGLCIYFYPF